MEILEPIHGGKFRIKTAWGADFEWDRILSEEEQKQIEENPYVMFTKPGGLE